MREPARINAGRAMRGKEPTDVNAICTNLMGLSSRKIKAPIADTPREIEMGAPSKSRPINPPKRT
jgi:hypothetical protein